MTLPPDQSDPEGRPSVEDILFNALEVTASERRSFVVNAAGDDVALRDEVLSLLDAHNLAKGFMEQPAIPRPNGTHGQDELTSGMKLGAYRIERVIGTGGMGSVYLAERADDHYRKRVAIKVIRAGLDREDILRRFRLERQVLANLEHPHIAHLLDGGVSDDGRPFLVMEYVEGVPIDQYSDTRGLPIAARLRLFLQICDAVQYAHQNLIVHRDLKPGNILVSETGDVKLLDFGIAKVLHPTSAGTVPDQTLTEIRVMTPRYASPEQVSGHPVTTSTDVYSLGIILYELLTGRLPYGERKSGQAELARQICNERPTRPSAAVTTHISSVDDTDEHRTTTPEQRSAARGVDPRTLRRRLSGDLDTIVLMAIRKEADRRYASAQQLADDIRRYLAGMPVSARPDTFLYRSSKFVRRNRFGVAAAVVLLISLVVGIVAVSWQAQVASAQRARAEQRFKDVRALANTLIFDIHDAIRDLPGSTAARQTLMSKATTYLDSLVQDAGDDPELLAELAVAYEGLGDVQRSVIGSDAGDTRGALHSHQQALDLRARVFDMAGDNASRAVLAISHSRMGDMYRMTNDLATSQQHYEASLRITRALLAKQPDDLRTARSNLTSLLKLGIVHHGRGEHAAAQAAYTEAQEACRALIIRQPEDRTTRRNLGICHEKLGDSLQVSGDARRALASYLRALDIYRELDAEDQSSTTQTTVAIACMKVAEVRGHPAYSNLGDVEGAVEAMAEGLAIVEQVARDDPGDARARMLTGVFARGVATILVAAERYDEAMAAFNRSLSVFEAIAATDSENSPAMRQLASCYSGIGDEHVRAGDTDLGIEHYERAAPILRKLFDADRSNLLIRQDIAVLERRFGDAYSKRADNTPLPSARSGDIRAALDSYLRSLQMYEAIRDDGAMVAADRDVIPHLEGRIRECQAMLGGSGA